ncbi:uncharacterized protein LOC141641324 [Silene latifolia]|uniref:uncharacterized protein LOC141641324 n=1 Tax=Silene latifolia TaxID=37657 RepID=UPI003D7702C3
MGRGKYNYPKTFITETTTNSDGYPEYRRRDDGQAAVVRKQTLDNRWVIPYNPFLLSLFDCHLNVKVCSTIQAVKYLYKYVYKGHDRISFNVIISADPKPVDEIEQYQSGRWVSPCEAMWRLYGFELFETHPPVMVLPVHLQNMQTMRLHPEENLELVVANEKRARTPLTEFFVENSKEGTEPLLYADLTKKYRGTKDRSDEAALKRRLIEEDNTVDLCLNEACEVQMPSALRHLFAIVLIFSQPKDPAALWTKYYCHLSQDFNHKFPNDPNKVSRLTAFSVEISLEAMGKSLKAFNLEHLMESEDDEI